jgi:hypothetical protein
MNARDASDALASSLILHRDGNLAQQTMFSLSKSSAEILAAAKKLQIPSRKPKTDITQQFKELTSTFSAQPSTREPKVLATSSSFRQHDLASDVHPTNIHFVDPIIPESLQPAFDIKESRDVEDLFHDELHLDTWVYSFTPCNIFILSCSFL